MMRLCAWAKEGWRGDRRVGYKVEAEASWIAKFGHYTVHTWQYIRSCLALLDKCSTDSMGGHACLGKQCKCSGRWEARQKMHDTLLLCYSMYP